MAKQIRMHVRTSKGREWHEVLTQDGYSSSEWKSALDDVAKFCGKIFTNFNKEEIRRYGYDAEIRMLMSATVEDVDTQ